MRKWFSLSRRCICEQSASMAWFLPKVFCTYQSLFSSLISFILLPVLKLQAHETFFYRGSPVCRAALREAFSSQHTDISPHSAPAPPRHTCQSHENQPGRAAFTQQLSSFFWTDPQFHPPCVEMFAVCCRSLKWLFTPTQLFLKTHKCLFFWVVGLRQ